MGEKRRRKTVPDLTAPKNCFKHIPGNYKILLKLMYISELQQPEFDRITYLLPDSSYFIPPFKKLSQKLHPAEKKT